MHDMGKSSPSRSTADRAIDLAASPRQLGRRQGLPSRNGSEAKREAGAMLQRSTKTGAAPATVNGEFLSKDATGF